MPSLIDEINVRLKLKGLPQITDRMLVEIIRTLGGHILLTIANECPPDQVPAWTYRSLGAHLMDEPTSAIPPEDFE